MRRIYLNDNDRTAAAWLRELVRTGELPGADVDDRSIDDIRPGDLDGYDQCHFFAGVGGWPLALRLAGWADEHVWTGSCPCQPFSTAGKRRGEADARHLWPSFRRLIAERRPAVVFGKQVAGKAGRRWLAGVRADLEALGYAVGAADLCAAGVAAPHIRQRLFWVADADGRRLGAQTGGRLHDLEDYAQPRGVAGGFDDAGGIRRRTGRTDHSGHDGHVAGAAVAAGRMGEAAVVGCRPEPDGGGDRAVPRTRGQRVAGGTGPAGRLGDAAGDRQRPGPGGQGRDGTDGVGLAGPGARGHAFDGGGAGRLGHAEGGRPPGARHAGASGPEAGQGPRVLRPAQPGAWDRFDVIQCTDGAARRVEPGSFPLAHGVSGRVGLLRGYGNAIVPQLAAEFVRAFLEVKEGSA